MFTRAREAETLWSRRFPGRWSSSLRRPTDAGHTLTVVGAAVRFQGVDVVGAPRSSSDDARIGVAVEMPVGRDERCDREDRQNPVLDLTRNRVVPLCGERGGDVDEVRGDHLEGAFGDHGGERQEDHHAGEGPADEWFFAVGVFEYAVLHHQADEEESSGDETCRHPEAVVVDFRQRAGGPAEGEKRTHRRSSVEVQTHSKPMFYIIALKYKIVNIYLAYTPLICAEGFYFSFNL